MTTPANSSPVELRPNSPADVSQLLQTRFDQGGRSVRVVGGETPGSEGTDPAVDRLMMSGLARVIDYPARDMTITVEAGINVASLRSTLAEEGQRLAVDIPHAERTTLGAAIAGNISGPGRFGNGTFRDYVIGIRAVDGQGRLFAAGGRVVKNVAGYDLCKLLVGSRGTLAVIVEVTLKLRPLPESREVISVAFDRWDQVEPVVAGLLNSGTRPVAIELLSPAAAARLALPGRSAPPPGPVLFIVYEGSRAETAWQIETVARELAAGLSEFQVAPESLDTGSLYAALVESTVSRDNPPSFEAALPPSKLVDWMQSADDAGLIVRAHAGDGIVQGTFPPEWLEHHLEEARLTAILSSVTNRGGSLGRLRGTAHGNSSAALSAGFRVRSELTARIKRAFDPRGLLNPHIALY